ncbi:MAG: metallophosphoesterase, partial [Planctomycetota bacterium]
MTLLSLSLSLGLLAAASSPQTPSPPTLPALAPPHVDAPAAIDTARFLTNRKSGVDLPLPEEEEAFFFVVYGDRTGGPASGVALLREAVAETNLLGPDLVMTVGDLIQGYNEPDAWMAQMREYHDAMAPLRMPWFPVAGNHDIYYRSRDRSVPRPAEEHEARYEMHFGPLWYAFRHKSAWFIVLYTDEPNPDTGERNFNDPDCQRMSPEQLAWLDETLKVTSDAPHVFVFCHHPRWIDGRYGNDWDKVHQRLVKAGNVKGVFGGHIHRMRYDPRDGIEYFALATVG